MKVLMIMYDSLNKRFLSSYGNNKVITPNFARLADHSVTFDCFHSGSLPCMPARRELHTGRYNFLHRSWGPLEPFDESMPQMLRDHGIYTHLITDHCHYWEDGGATYHNRFTTYELVRGQEGDPWIGEANHYDCVDSIRQDKINRQSMLNEEDHFHARVCKKALDFLERNHDQDNWFLQVEYFDPHEPYFVPEKYVKMYTDEKPAFDWPQNMPLVDQGDTNIQEAVINYQALLTMCDVYLGKILDLLDKYELWKDTMVIVNTDHGYMLGEKGHVGKNYMPPYEEIVNTPFFIWDPRVKKRGVRSTALAQTIDIAPTILSLFGVNKGKHMQGKDLLKAQLDQKFRDAALFGYHGMHVCVTDGQYVYMRCSQNEENTPLFEYTLMPARIKSMFRIEELKQMEMPTAEFAFTEYTPVMKIPSDERYDKRIYFKCSDHRKFGSLLFDLITDPMQERPIQDEIQEERMLGLLRICMQENEAPTEQYERLGLQ